MSTSDLLNSLRLLEQDHGPDGFPAVQMRHITQLLDKFERLQNICTSAHDALLRGADDRELIALLATAWSEEPKPPEKIHRTNLDDLLRLRDKAMAVAPAVGAAYQTPPRWQQLGCKSQDEYNEFQAWRAQRHPENASALACGLGAAQRAGNRGPTAMTLFEEATMQPAVGTPVDQRVVQHGGGRGGVGTHQSAAMKNDEWLTPPHVLQALGPFDLDPCAPVVRPWPMAATHYTAADNGLAKPWYGRVWLNPPYGQETAKWMERLADHGNGVALIFARTETAIFFPWVWERATAWLFLKGRLHFHFVDGTRAAANSGAPSVLVAYGEANAHALACSGLAGKMLHNVGVQRRAAPGGTSAATTG